MPGGLVLEEEGRAGRSYYRQQSLAEAREEARVEIEAQRRDQHVRQAEQNEQRRTPDAWDPEYVVQAQFDFEEAFLHGRPTAWEVADLDTMYADYVRGAVTPAARIFHASAPFLLGGALAALWSVLRHPQSGPVTQARHDQALELAQPFQRPPAGGFDFTPRIEEQARFSMNMASTQMGPSVGPSLTFRATDAWGVQNLPVINWARTRGMELVTDLTEQQLLTTQGIILDALGGNLARETVAPLIELTIDLHPTQARWVQDRLARDLASGMPRQEAYIQSRAFSEQLLRQRAMTIARTEIMAAENMGQLEAWRQAARDGLLPKEARKVWVMGPGACPTCATVNGKAVKLEDPFPVVDVLVPPAHPNCRCTVGLAADRGRVADLAGINLRTHQPLAKHQPGGHDQKTHGHRGNAGGEQERIDKATARIQAALPNADLTGLSSQMSTVMKDTLDQMNDGRSVSYNAMLEAGFPRMEWDKALHGVKLKPTASELEAIADAAEHLRKVAPLAADDCKRLEFQALMDDNGMSKNLAQANWAEGGWRITYDLERTRFTLGEQFGGKQAAETTRAARLRSSSLFRQADSPRAAQNVIALHEFAHGVAMSGEASHRSMFNRGMSNTEQLLFFPSPSGLAAAPSNSTHPRSPARDYTASNPESTPIFSRPSRPVTEAVSAYALSNPGEFFAENVASLWTGINRPHYDTQHWLNEYIHYRENGRLAKAATSPMDIPEDGAIEDDFGEEPWPGWETEAETEVREIRKHSGGTGHDQKTHGNWARGSDSGIPFDGKGELRALSIPDRKAAWDALSVKERDAQANPVKTIGDRITEVTKPLGDWGDSGDLKADVAARVKKAGDLIPADSQKLISDHMQQLADELAASGVDAKLARKITTEATDALIAQDYESLGRTLGDHGARHLMQDADYTMAQMRELSTLHPALDSPEMRAAAILTAVYHDAGYMTPPSRAFLDEGHPRWSQDYFDAKIGADIEAAFGRGTRDLVSLTIASHDSIRMDWVKRPFSSAFRLSDNLGLFHAEKLPPFMHAVPRNVGVIARLGRDLAQPNADVGAAVRRAQSEARANIQAQPGLSSQQRLRMLDAVEEISPILPKLSLGMVGGRLTGFTWNQRTGTMEATAQRSREADDISRVIDVGQRQFIKLAETYHVDPASVRQDNRMDFDADGDGVPDFSLTITGQLLKHLRGQHDQKSHGRRGAGGGSPMMHSSQGMDGLGEAQRKAITDAMAERGVTQESLDAQIQKLAELAMSTEGVPATWDGAVELGKDWYGIQADRVMEVFKDEYGLDLPESVAFALVASLSPNLDWDAVRVTDGKYVEINAPLAAHMAKVWMDRYNIDVPINEEAARLLNEHGANVKAGTTIKLGSLTTDQAAIVMASHLGKLGEDGQMHPDSKGKWSGGVLQREGWNTTIQAYSSNYRRALAILDTHLNGGDTAAAIDRGLNGPKIRNFYNSFVTRGEWPGGVIDAWMLRAMIPEGARWPTENPGKGIPNTGPVRRPGHGWLDGDPKPSASVLGTPERTPGGRNTPSDWVHNAGVHPMFQEALLREARNRKMRVSDLQAIIWYYMRGPDGRGRHF